MARLNGNMKGKGLLLILGVGFLLAIGAAAFILLRKPNEFANLPAFPVDSYLEGRNLIGLDNYKLEGRVDNVLLRSTTGDKFLVVVQPEGSDSRLPIMLERKGGGIPVQREQHLVFRVNLGPLSQLQCSLFGPK